MMVMVERRLWCSVVMMGVVTMVMVVVELHGVVVAVVVFTIDPHRSGLLF